MRIDDLIKKLEGPMSEKWQKAHDLKISSEFLERKQEEDAIAVGKELCEFARRVLSLRIQEVAKGRWCGVELIGPGYILQHDVSPALKKPYLRFHINIGGNSRIEYNHWPKDRIDIEAVCIRLTEATAALVRNTSLSRLPT